MHFDPPDEDAYSRITNPERFQPVVDAAERLIDRLVVDHEVNRTAGVSGSDFPEWVDAEIETVRLVPGVGVPIYFMATGFPGVIVRFGRWGREAFPACGCDACDESPEHLIEEMYVLAEGAVAGGYQETLKRRSLGYGVVFPGGKRWLEQKLRRGQWRDYGDPEAHSWPPWRPRH